MVKDEFAKAGKDVGVIDYAKYSKSEDGLGKYLDGLLDRKEFSAKETSTLKGKVKFCEKSFELMSQTDFQWQLTPALNELCEKVYQFILKQNE
jgi:hypothetical protein